MCAENCADHYKKLEEKDLKFLDDYLVQQCGTPLVQMHGFLTAISSLPYPVGPERWVEDLGLTKGTKSDEEAGDLLAKIEAFHFELYDDLGGDTFMPSILVNLYDEQASDEAKKQSLAPWAKGYSQALSIYAKDRAVLVTSPHINTFLFVIESLDVSDEELLKGLNVSTMDEIPEQINELRKMATNLTALMDIAQMISKDWFALSVQKTMKRIKAVGNKRQGSKYKNAPRRKRKLMRQADMASGK